jgi:dolichol-phosphate mannosyltransferase
MGMTASAPSGTTPPVAIAIASPASSFFSAGTPAAIRATTGSRPGVSPERTAKPSIAELGNGGRSTPARASSAAIRPAASARRTSSASSGVVRSRTCDSAAASESSSAMARSAYNFESVVSVVVPVHDEERSVALLYDELGSALDPLGIPWETIFVDDGSTDGTFAALTRLHNATANVRVVRLRRNFGKAAALVAGFDQARGDIVVTIDGDLQDDPAEIPRLLAKLDEGFDLVSGWKTRRQDPLSRRVLSKIFNRVTSAFSGVRLHDMNCGLKAYRADVVHGLRLYGELHRFIPVLAHYRGFRIAELPVNHRPREHGRSRYGVERYLRGFLDLLTVSFIGRYRHRPLHLFGGLGLILGLIGGAVLVYLTVVKALGHAIGQRPLLLLGVLLVVIGMQFFSLGLISEMITSHHEERARERDRAELLVDEVLS